MSTSLICPNCNGQKQSRSKLCKICYTLEHPSKTLKPCLYCSELTYNPKFCNGSCAATYNNTGRKWPNRKKRAIRKVYYCISCGKKTTNKSKRCKECYLTNTTQYIVLSDLPNQGANSYNIIRQRARVTYKKSDQSYTCAICGYSKHTEICHIKPVASYPPTTLISDINNINNLIALCPNCHWELDHDLLKL